jgi:hypothetical protein
MPDPYERTRFIRRAYRIAPARVHEAGVMRSKSR